MNTRDTKQQPRPTPKGNRGSVATPKKPRKPAPAAKRGKPVSTGIVYTQPKPFNRNRFFLRLVTVAAVVLALTFSMAIFFKVKHVTVSGAEKYTAWEIKEASGIQEGENLLTQSDAKIGGRITTALPYVNKVRVGIKLPDTVNIEIVELDVVYALQATDNSWWLIDADGKVIDSTNGAEAKAYTKVLGFQIEVPTIGEQAVAAQPEPETVETSTETQSVETTAPVTVRADEKLEMAVTILQYLEDNGIIGELKSVDVSNLKEMELWYGERFQIRLGDSTQLGYKISSMKAIIDSPEMGQYSSGILDVSFTTWPDSVGYTPFSQE